MSPVIVHASMPAGEPFAREIRSRDTPEELQHRVVVQLTALLAPAKYKLAAQSAESVEYRRQYLPTGPVAIALGLAGLGALAAASGGLEPLLAALAGVLAIPLLLIRRSETLVVRVERRPGGSAALVSGHLNGRGRMALLGLDPLSQPRFHEPQRHLRLVVE
jgi:hypothetical protein